MTHEALRPDRGPEPPPSVQAGARSVRRRLRAWLHRHEPPETAVLLSTALLVGIAAGGGAVLLRTLIDGVGELALGAGVVSPLRVALIPALGGLLVGALTCWLAPEARRSGIPEVIEAVTLRGGRIRPIVIPVKALASAITIGTGGSVGREGPIVHIGAALGSTVGQALHLSDERIRNLVACGAAAGIAATFNTPIAGVLFALEVVLGEFGASNFGVVVVASVAASVIGRAVFGDVPAFDVPAYALRSNWEFGLYALLGLAAAVLAWAYTRMLYGAEDRFEALSTLPAWLKPALGGALLGLLALGYSQVPGLGYGGLPQVYGVGYDTITAVLRSPWPVGVMLALLLLKLVATSLTLGSGGSGGMFAPALFIGALLGTSFGTAAGWLMPEIVGPAGAYGLVGMAAVLSGAARTPITAVVMMFELTGDYRIILPLMLAVVISTSLGQYLLDGESVYTVRLIRRGIRLSAGRAVDVLQGIRVGEVMATDVPTVRADMTLDALADRLSHSGARSFPVVEDAARLVGIVTAQDVERAFDAGLPRQTPLTEITTRDLLVATSDEPMGDALRRMGVRGVSQLPVVARDDAERLVGLVTAEAIVRAYNLALTRWAEVHYREQRIRHRAVGDLELIDLELEAADPAVGCSVAELAPELPRAALIVSIQRADGQQLIPHGSTRFRAGDVVSVLADPPVLEDARRRFKREGDT